MKFTPKHDSLVSVHARPSTDMSESWVATHTQKEYTLVEEICEEEGVRG